MGMTQQIIYFKNELRFGNYIFGPQKVVLQENIIIFSIFFSCPFYGSDFSTILQAG